MFSLSQSNTVVYKLPERYTSTQSEVLKSYCLKFRDNPSRPHSKNQSSINSGMLTVYMGTPHHTIHHHHAPYAWQVFTLKRNLQSVKIKSY